MRQSEGEKSRAKYQRLRMKSFLLLEDNSLYEGEAFGASATAYGEVVFNTSMTGYQEMLTDPSYAGQIVIPTYPIIGNYGINDTDIESRRIQVRGFIVREHCDIPSHWQSNKTLNEYLEGNSVPGLSGVDTRSLTRKLRRAGVMMGVLTSEMQIEEAKEYLRAQPSYGNVDFVPEVSVLETYQWDGAIPAKDGGPHIVVVDLGVKYNILRLLKSAGCSVTVVPCHTSAADILELKPDGVVISPGPGDPALLDYTLKSIEGYIYSLPVMGICLGHQLIGRLFGGKTFKLKFGHRGANHPVKDLVKGTVYITAQNHGYAVDPDSLTGGLTVNRININDNTVEGFSHKELPVFTIQYHSEASPGPRDNEYLFAEFLSMVKKNKR